MTGCLQLLTALTLTGPIPAAPASPELSQPLSPAGLVAPVPPAAMAAPGSGSISWSLQFGHTGGTPDECRLKAVAAIAALDRFRFAEIGPDGNVRGYTETCRVEVIVVVTPPHDGAMMYTLAVSRESGAERVGAAIAEHLAKAPRDPRTPERAGARAPEVEKQLFQIGWHFGTRPANRLGRHFGPVAELVLEKRGYTAHMGPTSSVMTAAFGVREGHFTVAARTDGVPGMSVNVLVATFGSDAAAAAREAKAVGTAVLTTLFE